MSTSAGHGLPELAGKLKKDKKTLIIIGCGMLGMLLLLLSVISELPGKTEKSTDTTDTQALCRETEKRLSEMLENVMDAGKTEVMITFDTMEKYVYANDSENEKSENGASEKHEYVIISESGDSQKGLVSTVYLPSVRGVAVICEGGGSAQVREEVTRLVCAALGISSAKVYVAQKVNSQ